MYVLEIKYRSGRRRKATYESRKDLITTINTIVQDFCFVDEWTVTLNGRTIKGTKDKYGKWKNNIREGE